MRRRDFALSAAAMSAGVFLRSQANGQTNFAQPVRTASLTDSSTISGNVSCQDLLFDGTQIVALYRSVAAGGAAASSDSKYGITATDTSGKVLWSYPLPTGMYGSLGKYQGSIVIFAFGTIQLPGGAAFRPVLLLDSQTGNLMAIGQHDAAGLFTYAGDSTFFRIVQGAGQVWSLENGLVQKVSAVTAPAIAAKFSQRSLISSGTFAVVDSVGQSQAMVALDTGAVTASSISSEAVTNARAASAAALERAASNPRMATIVFITAIGSDQNGALYAAVPAPKGPTGTLPVISLNPDGVGSTLGMVQFRTLGIAMSLLATNSELAVSTSAGEIAWYALPLA